MFMVYQLDHKLALGNMLGIREIEICQMEGGLLLIMHKNGTADCNTLVHINSLLNTCML